MPQFDPRTQSQDHVRPFRLTEQRVWPGCIEIEVEGELDFVASDQLRAALDSAQDDPRHVLLDFGACSFIDSSGLTVLVAARRFLADRDRQLLLYGVHGQVRRMLSVTGLTEDGVLVPSKDADTLSSNGRGEPAPGQSFEVTAAGRQSARLPLPGGAPA